MSPDATRSQPPGSEEVRATQLCGACGLCCNGVLFGNVQLQPGDDPLRLAALGLNLQSRGRKTRFCQPCPALEGGGLCSIYSERPSRCQSFECRLLQRVQNGETTHGAALKTIHQTKLAVEEVRTLVRRLGNQDEALPLNRRCARIVAGPMDLSRASTLRLRSRLMSAINRMTKLLERFSL